MHGLHLAAGSACPVAAARVDPPQAPRNSPKLGTRRPQRSLAETSLGGKPKGWAKSAKLFEGKPKQGCFNGSKKVEKGWPFSTDGVSKEVILSEGIQTAARVPGWNIFCKNQRVKGLNWAGNGAVSYGLVAPLFWPMAWVGGDDTGKVSRRA